MYQTIFLRENEKDIFQTLKNQGIKTKVFEHRLAELFNRVYNNFVGYYSFRQEGIVYKIIVLPKTIPPSEYAEKEFVDYLLHYYRINNIYKFDTQRKIPNSLLQLAFETNNSKERGHHFLEAFQSHRYRAILQAIERFFKRHKNSERRKQDYISQSIKHKLNLKKNIKEIDKTKIHQIQTKEIPFSLLATVTYYALKLFVIHKDNTKSETVVKEAKKVQSKLLKKYKIERGYKLSLQKLQSIKIEKLFSKTQESRQLLVDIKSLFGFEQMYKDDAISLGYRQDLTTSSLFINPNIFYEWYVYDILKKYTEENGKKIEFDKQDRTKTEYLLNEEKKSSNPDYILTDESKKVKIVIDAKWKTVEKIGDIQSGDYLKLKFDTYLLEKKGYAVVPYLVYPAMKIEDRAFMIKSEEDTVFQFHALKIDMAFEKYGNSLEFDYDLQELQERIENEERAQTIKHAGAESSVAIEPMRDTLVSNLIHAEDEEKKEELGGLFDEALYAESQKLAQTLDKEIILPLVEEILDEFQDIMEDESITFIKSTSTIYGHYKDEENIVFDFAMPGSGLWKLIEVELNTSFVRYVRYKEGVISKYTSWDAIIHADKEINIKWVKLNERNKNNSLKGLMFGQLKFLMKNTYVKSIFDGIVQYDFDNQWYILDKVTTFRNEHAHIKAMPKEIFEELWNLLFEKDDSGKNEMQKLLSFKRNIKAYIDEQ